MSTKTTRKYVSTKEFYLHLYNDFAGNSGMQLRVGGAETFLPLSSEEIDEIDAQLEGKDPSPYTNEDTKEEFEYE